LYTLVMEVKQGSVRDPVPSRTYSNKFTHSPLNLQGANVNDEAWKTHTTRKDTTCNHCFNYFSSM